MSLGYQSPSSSPSRFTTTECRIKSTQYSMIFSISIYPFIQLPCLIFYYTEKSDICWRRIYELAEAWLDDTYNTLRYNILISKCTSCRVIMDKNQTYLFNIILCVKRLRPRIWHYSQVRSFYAHNWIKGLYESIAPWTFHGDNTFCKLFTCSRIARRRRIIIWSTNCNGQLNIHDGCYCLEVTYGLYGWPVLFKLQRSKNNIHDTARYALTKSYI